jgi:hypothetical protein
MLKQQVITALMPRRLIRPSFSLSPFAACSHAGGSVCSSGRNPLSFGRRRESAYVVGGDRIRVAERAVAVEAVLGRRVLVLAAVVVDAASDQVLVNPFVPAGYVAFIGRGRPSLLVRWTMVDPVGADRRVGRRHSCTLPAAIRPAS